MNETVKIIPKNIPFKCPNCNGFGTLQYGKKECHSCKGTGIIIINQDDRETSYGQPRVDKTT